MTGMAPEVDPSFRRFVFRDGNTLTAFGTQFPAGRFAVMFTEDGPPGTLLLFPDGKYEDVEELLKPGEVLVWIDPPEPR